MKFDIVVVGSGIAGLSFALKTAKLGYKVAIVTKKERSDTNTNHAQGGIASVTSGADDFDSHVKDTLVAGDGLCDENAVREIVKSGPQQIKELIEDGVEFTSLADGSLSLGREGGHSQRRILHVKDYTGRAIEEALLKCIAENKNISVFEHHFAIDLITRAKAGQTLIEQQSNDIVGLYVYDTKNSVVKTFKTPVVMLATGGTGCVYLYTTNPTIATGDGIAMAYRAGAEVANLEFIQFHPTALYSQTGERFLISEAVRGEGAILRNIKGEAFMSRYDSRKDLAPRDIVARAIDSEMKRLGSPHVWLDITHKSADELKTRFPQIYEHCLKNGIDISKDYMPVVPAAHYMCGGVKTALDASTTIKGLYACGEVSCTGLHGANRLASNSLLEAVVLANNATQAVDEYLKNTKFAECDVPLWRDGDVRNPDERVVLQHNMGELQRTMWDYVGIVRTTKRLERALNRLENLHREIDEYYWNFKIEPALIELRNEVQVAILIIRSALARHESRGLHYTLDFPEKLPVAHNTILKRESF
ncbi:MAG: L-aspartate oxidase [Opitutales bacterium]|nr:L-aspartate oxidase [Opitutales bacterium]MBP3357747.1 L-aspartate oxidase [Opitutales bacterium]